jgi:hypothetical protein
MEKISNIVRGNARVAAADVKSAGAVRPGALAFGRPIGESPEVTGRSETTAERAGHLQSAMTEARKARSNDRVVAEMADQFFMTRVRRPEEQVAAPVSPRAKISRQEADAEAPDEVAGDGEAEALEAAQPQGFVPRGSYVNVKA